MKKFIVFILMALVMCSCSIHNERIEHNKMIRKADSLSRVCYRQQKTIDSLSRLTLKTELLNTYGKAIVKKYESYTTHYDVDWNGNRKYNNFDHYADRDKAIFYCNQIKKLKNYVDINVKTKRINELDWELDADQIKFLKKIYRLYKLYGYDGVEAINEWQPIQEVERLINKQWNRYDSDFIKSVVNEYY
jgi:hypothetical protein